MLPPARRTIATAGMWMGVRAAAPPGAGSTPWRDSNGRGRASAGGVLGGRADDLRPGGAREVVPHALDLHEPRARDRLRGGAAAGGAHELVLRTVDDHGRHGHAAQAGGAVAGGDDRRELPAGAGGVAPAVVAAAGHVAQVVLVAVEAGRADHAVHLQDVVD